MKIESSHILLPKIRLYAYHGVLPQEQTIGAYFSVSLEIDTDFESALETDDLSGTISYADIYKSVEEEMRIPSRLLEHVAGRIAKRLFKDFPAINQMKIELFKENPPIGGAECTQAGIRLVAVNR